MRWNKMRIHLVVVMMVAGNRSKRLENEVHGRVQFFLQSLQIQNPALPALTVIGQDLCQRMDHILSTADECLVGDRSNKQVCNCTCSRTMDESGFVGDEETGGKSLRV